MRNELPRRLFHACGCLLLPIAALWLPQNIFLPALTSITALFLLFELTRLKSPRINRWFFNSFKILVREKEKRKLTGTSYLLVASVIVFWFFDKSIAALSLAFLAVGDPIGSAVGEKWGKKKIRGKSLEGSLAFCLASLIFGIILNMVTHVPLPILLVGIFSATITEFLSLPPNDNFTVPLVSSGMMTLIKVVTL